MFLKQVKNINLRSFVYFFKNDIGFSFQVGDFSFQEFNPRELEMKNLQLEMKTL